VKTFTSKVVLLQFIIIALGINSYGVEPISIFPPVINIENLIYVSWGDQIMTVRGDAQLDTPEKINRAMKMWMHEYEGKAILWRCSSSVIKEFYESRQSDDFTKSYFNKVAEISKKFDPIKVAREFAKKNGQQFLLYMTIFDHGAPVDVLYGAGTPFPWQDRLTIKHPEFQPIDRNGNYQYGPLEMAYPEARKAMVERIKYFISKYDADGVYVCTRTHSFPAEHADQFGFNKPIVEEYQRLYGINILEDLRFDYKSPDFNSTDQAVEKWRILRGKYLVQFYKELREAVPDRVIYTGIPRGRYIGAPYGNLYLDWETIVREQLVDGLVIGVFTGKGLYPKKMSISHRAIGYLSSEDDNIGVPASFEEAVSRVYGDLCRSNNVKLFCNTGCYGLGQRQWLTHEPLCKGVMIFCPSGTGAVVEHKDVLCFPNGRMTIEAFIYLNNRRIEPDRYFRILSKYNHIEQGRHRGWEWNIYPNDHFVFRVNIMSPDSNSNGDILLESRQALPLGEWIHVATVYDLPNRRMRLYLNGKLDNEKIIPTFCPRVNSSQDLYIGRYGGQNSHVFDGMIDELRISADALDFNSPPTSPYRDGEPNTICLFHFDNLTIGDAPRFPNNSGQNGSAKLLGGGEEVLTKSLPCFGKAFSLIQDVK